MHSLTGKELSRLSAFLRDLYELRSHEEFTSYLLRALPQITEGDFTSYNEIHIGKGISVFKTDLKTFLDRPQHYAEILTRHADTHPVLAHMKGTRDGAAVTITDFMPFSKFCDTALYGDFYKPLGIPHLIGIALTIENGHSITVARHQARKEFSEETRATLNAIRPHLVQAYRNAMAFTKARAQCAMLGQVLETFDQALITIDQRGEILWSTARAETLLTKYGLRRSWNQRRISDRILRWVHHRTYQTKSKGEICSPMTPLLIQSEKAHLSARLLRTCDHSLILLTHHTDPDCVMPNLSSLGLSPRQSEVMHWLAQGKSNPEIGTILSISPRTVQKHLEHAYKQLGVENRHAAIRVMLGLSQMEVVTDQREP